MSLSGITSLKPAAPFQIITWVGEALSSTWRSCVEFVSRNLPAICIVVCCDAQHCTYTCSSWCRSWLITYTTAERDHLVVAHACVQARAVVVVPSNVLIKWDEEFHEWLPRDPNPNTRNPVFKFGGATQAYLKDLRRWMETPGSVLLTTHTM
jgi:hypothetical protein